MPLQKVIGSLIEPNSITIDKLPPGFPSWDPSGVIRNDAIQSNTTIVSSVSTNFGNVNSFRLTNEQRIYSRRTSYTDVSYLTFNNTTKTIDNVIGQFSFALDGATMRPSAYAGVSTYIYTGANQTFTVPAGVRFIFAKLWGAGGGEGRSGGWSYGSDGGGGGHTRGIIPVTPGEALTLVVGRGGLTTSGTAQYGGGGYQPNEAADGNKYGGMGGGYAGIFRGTITAGNALLIAGGGGGGGSARSWARGNNGGAGGGKTGCTGDSLFDNKPTYAGTGGTQTAGGSAPVVGGITVGAQLQGGNGVANSYGGGGGAGWYGGGGGAYSEANTMAGGGGGSGYVHSSVILGDTFAGCERTPAFFWDSDLAQNTRNGGPVTNAVGGRTNNNGRGAGAPSGGNAYIVIYY
jgi:hypothetical protein